MTPPVVIHRTTDSSIIERPGPPPVTFFSADFWPFSVFMQDGRIVLIFNDEPADIVLLLEPASHSWLSGLEHHELTIDLRGISRVSSPLAAWLCMASSYGLPITLTGVGQRMMVQLALLRIDRLFTIQAAA